MKALKYTFVVFQSLLNPAVKIPSVYKLLIDWLPSRSGSLFSSLIFFCELLGNGESFEVKLPSCALDKLTSVDVFPV